MTAAEFQERYEFVLGWLQRRRAHIAAAVMRLGRVFLTDHVATAAIVAQEERVWLYFNPGFGETIDTPELAGVLTHEALHFVLRHQARAAVIPSRRDRYYFDLACEAVVNDLILASFKELKLPGDPVTGPWLVGQDTSQLSAEQVMQLLWRQREADGEALNRRLAIRETLDDHSVWDPNESVPPEPEASGDMPAGRPEARSGLWTEATSGLVAGLLAGMTSADPCYGTVAAGTHRPAPPARTCRRNLARFLEDAISLGMSYDTLWVVPNRKFLLLYPRVVLPTYEPRPWCEVLIAIDTSGSVPASFLSVAMAFARERRPRTRLTLISFDTVWYEASTNDATLRGSGGTRAQAVEEYIQTRMRGYPDVVFLLTDGWTPPPAPAHPERWIWLLPPWGSTAAMPRGSVAEFFATEEIQGAGGVSAAPVSSAHPRSTSKPPRRGRKPAPRPKSGLGP